MKAEEFEQEWKRYCDSKGGGAVTISIKDVAKHFAQWQKEQMLKDAVEVEVFDDWEYGKDADRIAQPAIKLRCLGLKIGQKVKVIIIKE